MKVSRKVFNKVQMMKKNQNVNANVLCKCQSLNKMTGSCYTMTGSS